MTRISAGIKANQLSDIHLRKERIEILRVPNKVRQNKYSTKTIPPISFVLGVGHEVYFKNKLKYIHSRYLELTEECIKRGFNVTNYSDAFKDLPEHLYNDWDDNIPRVKEIVSERIKERLLGMREVDLKYYGKPITVEELILKMK
jgi:deoxyribonuclease (pyrimidine dimer)